MGGINMNELLVQLVSVLLSGIGLSVGLTDITHMLNQK